MTEEQRSGFAAEIYNITAKLVAIGAEWQITNALEQAADWLSEGPCEHCDGYHDSGSC